MITDSHSKDFQILATKITNYIGQLNKTAKSWNKKVLEADSVEEYAVLLQTKLTDISHSFEEVLQVLAESQSLARSWRLRYEKLQALSKYTEAAPAKLNEQHVQPDLFHAAPLQKKSPKSTKSWTVAAPASKMSKVCYVPSPINRVTEKKIVR